MIVYNASLCDAREVKDTIVNKFTLINLLFVIIGFNLAKILVAKFMDKNEKYLGNHLIINRLKVLHFEPLIKKIQNKKNL